MKISIVTISFNQAQFVEKTILSVLSQKNDVDLEYIVIDAGSTDSSRDIINKYKNQIDHIVFEGDEGPADGLNKGFALATGDIFGFLNSDDTLLPGALKHIESAFEKHIGFDVISGHGYVIDENDKTIQKIYSHPFSLTGYAAGCCALVQQSTFFKSSAYRSIKGFNVDNKICWDGELMVDLSLNKAKFKLIREYLSCFRIYQDSITGSGQQVGQKFKEQHHKINKKIKDAGFIPKPRYIEWMLTRFRAPITLLDRMFDGVIHKDRVV